MPGSKTAKKVTRKCKFIMKRGPKKGKKCGKNCKNNDYCKDHNTTKKEYNKKKIQKIREVKNNNKIINKAKEIQKIEDIEVLRNTLSETMMKLENERMLLKYIIKKIQGIKIYLGHMTLDDLYDQKYGKCICYEEDNKYYGHCTCNCKECTRCYTVNSELFYNFIFPKIYMPYKVDSKEKVNEAKEKKKMQTLKERGEKLIPKIEYYKGCIKTLEKKIKKLNKDNIDEE